MRSVQELVDVARVVVELEGARVGKVRVGRDVGRRRRSVGHVDNDRVRVHAVHLGRRNVATKESRPDVQSLLDKVGRRRRDRREGPVAVRKVGSAVSRGQKRCSVGPGLRRVGRGVKRQKNVLLTRFDQQRTERDVFAVLTAISSLYVRALLAKMQNAVRTRGYPPARSCCWTIQTRCR